MGFFTDPAFFIIVGVLVIPAIVLGVLGRTSKVYGLVVSLVMLGLLFCRDLPGAAAFVIFLVVSASTAFATLHWFKKEDPHAVAYYRIMLAVALVPLATAKITAVFDANLLGFIGISYLTFKSVQVLIEIRDGLIEDLSLFDYLYFLVFFPVFTSGPIMRSRDFVGQINAELPKDEYLGLLSRGLGWFIRGVVYSFVLAMFFQWLEWFAPSAIGTATPQAAAFGQLAQCFGYGLYLFFDFAGYSCMAMGVGAALGVRVPDNFHAPFLAIDIKDFWNRWHLTLSFWLRDFVFMRLTRTFVKHKVFKSRLTTACVSFICNMGLMGVWHGLTPDYIVYGFYHGFLLALCEFYQKKSKFYKKHRKQRWFKCMTWAFTMVAIFFGFALFNGQVSTCLMGVING